MKIKIFIIIAILLFMVSIKSMAVLQSPDFPLLTPDQTNPFIAGMLRNAKLKAQELENQKALIASRYPNIQNKIMIFGGSDNSIYLGCLSCSYIDSESVLSTIGQYSSDISSTSIFNDISQYGSDISTYSACNDMATHPPVIVDSNGNYYGDLTLNSGDIHIVRSKKILDWLKFSVCKKTL